MKPHLYGPYLVPIIVPVGAIVLRSIYRGIKRWGLPGPWGIPFIGQFWDITRIHLCFDSYHKRYGSTWFTEMAGTDVVVTADWDLMTYIFENREKYPNQLDFREALGRFTGPSMFLSEGQVWKEKRFTVNPLFHDKMLRHHVGVSVEKLKTLLDLISKDTPTNISPLLYRLTTDVIGLVAFGVDFRALDNPTLKWKDADGNGMTLAEIDRAVLRGSTFRLFFPFKFLWVLPFPMFRAEKRANDILRTLFAATISENASTPSESALNLPSLLLSAQNAEKATGLAKHKYSTQEMLAECYSFYFAGHETSATLASFMFWALGRWPEVQLRAKEEIKRIISATGRRDPVFEDLPQMQYLEGIVKETARLFPPALTLGREATENDRLKNWTITKGTKIFLNVYSYQRSSVFADAEEFKPERHSDPQCPPIASFGFGARACFGRRFVTMELKCLLFVLLQRFTISLVPSKPMEVRTAFGLKPSNDEVWVTLKEEPL